MLQQISVQELDFNPFTSLREDWAVVAAADDRGVNAMTIAWGGYGCIWNDYTATVYVRPERYTKSFIDNADYFTVTLFSGHKEALRVLGTLSGRDTDKFAAAGVQLVQQGELATFAEGSVALLCKKLYSSDLTDTWHEAGLQQKYYPDGGHHTMYIGRIEKAYRITDGR